MESRAYDCEGIFFVLKTEVFFFQCKTFSMSSRQSTFFFFFFFTIILKYVELHLRKHSANRIVHT